VGEARHGFELALRAEVPEPSPFYWEAFRRQVGRRVGRERHRTLRLWAPAFAAAAAVTVAIGLVSHRPTPAAVPASTLPAWSPALPAAGDDDLAVLGMTAPRPDELVPAAGCTGISRCLSDLNEDESRALAEALRRELGAES
jgi:hypothetical protein